MSYIGKVPTPVPLTSADLPDGGVTTAKLAASLSLTTPALGTPSSGNFSSGTFTWPSSLVSLTGVQTLTNKTITGTKETVYTITDGAGFEIDPANGGIQSITLGASRTPAATNFTSGQSVTLMIDDGSAYTITWTTVGVVWIGGTAPTLDTTKKTVVELWKNGSTIYGALVGAA
jgi:hypothetical protein